MIMIIITICLSTSGGDADSEHTKHPLMMRTAESQRENPRFLTVLLEEAWVCFQSLVCKAS